MFLSRLSLGITAFLTISCATREPVDILTGYEIAFTSEKPIRYFYHRMPEDDTTWTDYHPTWQDGQKYVIQEDYEDGQLTAKHKYRVTEGKQEAVEKIIYFVMDSTKGEREAVAATILEHAALKTSKGYPGSSFVDYYETSLGLGSKITTKNEVAGAQNYVYEGQEIPSLKITVAGKMITYFKYFPLYFHELDIEGYAIYSENLGMTYYWSNASDGTLYSQKLISIKWLD